MDRINRLEQQEFDLSARQNENERREKGIAMQKAKDEMLNKRLEIIIAKERILLENVCVGGIAINSDIYDNEYIQSGCFGMDRNTRCHYIDNKVWQRNEPKNKQSTYQMGLPKISNFNGKQFEQWKKEVTWALKRRVYPDYAIVQAEVNSLQDET